MAQIAQERIGKLTPMLDTEIQKIIKSQAEAAKWSLPVDYTAGDAGDVTTDQGSKQVPLSRIALLTTTGLVPQRMLPSRIDNVITGTMSDDCTTFTSDTSSAVVYKATTRATKVRNALPSMTCIPTGIPRRRITSSTGTCLPRISALRRRPVRSSLSRVTW